VIKLLLVFFSGLLALTVVISACKPAATSSSLTENERLELVKEIKAFQKKLGFNPTENFASVSDNKEAYDYYFYAPVTELPYSLDDPALKFGEGKRDNNSLDSRKYDVFYYSIPALAGISTPITKSLLESPLHRFIFIIFHEDWHEQIKSPLGIEEASGELMGYIPSLLFTEEKFGRDSEVYTTLNRELTNKLQEARVFQKYYDELTALYADYRGARISEVETLERIGILRDLRMGVFDVVVGINLLREGLDLPEVSLVAILDADKEGFLRSGTALIQTIGRAARHVHGQVIMYADRITDSMKFAIDETNRRRAKQVAYNTEHGIEPVSIFKAIHDLTDRLSVPSSVAESRAGYSADGKPHFTPIPPNELKRIINEMEKEMKQAAKDLEFEKAALLRDQIFEMRAILAEQSDIPAWQKARMLSGEIDRKSVV